MQSDLVRSACCGLLALLSITLPLPAATFDFSTGNDYGFTNGNTTNGSWAFNSNSWQLSYQDNSDVTLVSPVLTATGGAVTIQFSHAGNFEIPFDGGILELAINGGSYTKITAFSQNDYNSGNSGDSDVMAILGDTWFSGTFASLTSIASLGSLQTGDTLRVRWHSASDFSTSPDPPNWILNSVSVSSVVDPNAAPTGPSDGEPNAVPEPSTWSLAGAAFLGAFVLSKYNARRA